MRDLIGSPLQFSRPMTDEEWGELKLRETKREIRRERRRRGKQGSAPVAAMLGRRLESVRGDQAADSSGVF